MPTRATLKQRINLKKSVAHMKCCQTRTLVPVTTDSVNKVLAAQVAVVTHLAVAVSVTFLKHSSVVVQVGLVPVSKQGHHVAKI
jgi:hypothetical protein